MEWVVSGIQFRTADGDIVLDTIAVPEAQAERRLELSKAYQRSGVGLAVRPDTAGVAKFEDLIGRRVAVQSGSLAGMLLGQRGVRLSAFGFEDDMVEAVIRGEVDAAAVSPATVGYFNLRHPEARLRFIHAYEAEPELRWDLAVGLRRADASLREAIDGAIDRWWPMAPWARSTPATGSSTVRHSAAEAARSPAATAGWRYRRDRRRRRGIARASSDGASSSRFGHGGVRR